MFKKIFILISLFSFSFLIYFPLNKKEIDLNTDNICYYSDDNVRKYVKACDKGYYCNIIINRVPSIGICLEYNPGFKKYNEECSQNSECYLGLKCSNENRCIVNQNDPPYNYKDPASKKKYYYCSNYTFPKQTNTNGLICDNKIEKDKCVLEADQKSYSSDYLKVCGEFSEDFKSISTSDFKEVDDGKFVGDSLACKSGFALYFYKDRKIKSNSNEPKFQLCVTIKGVEKVEINNVTKCVIRYTNGSNEEYIYNPNDMNISLYEENNFPYCDAIMTKIEIIQEYFNKFDRLKTYCQQGNFYNEPFTCENDELRKIWYYYNNLEYYLLYKNDQEVLDYLVRNAYPIPKSKDKEEENKGSSGFLVNKYFLLLFLLAI